MAQAWTSYQYEEGGYNAQHWEITLDNDEADSEELYFNSNYQLTILILPSGDFDGSLDVEITNQTKERAEDATDGLWIVPIEGSAVTAQTAIANLGAGITGLRLDGTITAGSVRVSVCCASLRG